MIDQEARLLHAILAHAETGGRPALTSEGETVTWAELAPRVLGIAGALAAIPGDHERPIAIAGLNALELMVAYLGIVAAGRCAVPLPLSATPETVAGMIADCDPLLILADQTGFALIGQAHAALTIGLDFSADGVMPLADFLAGGAPLPGPADVAAPAEFKLI